MKAQRLAWNSEATLLSLTSCHNQRQAGQSPVSVVSGHKAITEPKLLEIVG